ncbi:MAG: tripartite tricarboxylate transporter permease [Deltaproteobacteria bacterium]|nr:tripartite tricarboxylate transporter permease [Deltaproteobacteria bacterium]
MLETFWGSLLSVLSWPAFGLLLLGTFIGFWIGLLPGIGVVATLSILLPFTFGMHPINAMALLIALHAVGATTGDITSILFGVPGEGSAAATILDGHPMAKKGEAGRALGAALGSSLVGGLIGALALAVSVPVLRPFVLTFTAAELFALIVLGLVFIASLTGSLWTRGVLMAGLGLILSTVGMDPNSSIPRYTVGQPYLWEGLPLAPVAIGLFAIPEVVDLAVRGTGIAGQDVRIAGGVLEGLKDTFRYWGITLRCSLIGTFVGVIPGLGGSVAQWVAYGHAVQSSRDKSRFGNGDVRGVLGPGAANNSKEGGDIIPTVGFGVPGSGGMAILLGGFLTLGLIPGPEMLTKHLDVVFSMVWTLVIANIIIAVVCLSFLNKIAKLTQIRGSIMIPCILFLVFMGAFSANNDLLDLVVMILFGVFGYIAVLLDWPRPPLVLGLVLGRLAEKYLYISVGAFGLSFLLRPLVILILLLAVGAVVYSIRSGKGSVQALPTET